MPSEIKTQVETSHDKTLLINGKKMNGVKAIVFTYDAGDTIATATLTMHIKRGSVAITDKDIQFETPGYHGEADGH